MTSLNPVEEILKQAKIEHAKASNFEVTRECEELKSFINNEMTKLLLDKDLTVKQAFIKLSMKLFGVGADSEVARIKR